MLYVETRTTHFSSSDPCCCFSPASLPNSLSSHWRRRLLLRCTRCCTDPEHRVDREVRGFRVVPTDPGFPDDRCRTDQAHLKRTRSDERNFCDAKCNRSLSKFKREPTARNFDLKTSDALYFLSNHHWRSHGGATDPYSGWDQLWICAQNR